MIVVRSCKPADIIARYRRGTTSSVRAPSRAPLKPSEPVMPTKFRKASIKSRRRTLALAGLGLIVETITSQPRGNPAAMTNVATMLRFAVAPLMASRGGLPLTGVPANDADPAVSGGADRTAWNCGRTHGAENERPNLARM
jgi:hypothetical protein